MVIRATLPAAGRDLRLDLMRGLANWAIFFDHIPNNVANWLTPRNYGFSDAADLFVFISGYTASFVFARIMLSRGFVIGATRLLRRAWQIYVAHVLLFVMYVAQISYLSHRYNNPALNDQFNIAGFLRDPGQTLMQGLLLAFKPVNMDVLPLYIVLMMFFPGVLWALLRWPNATFLGSVVLYISARWFDWNLGAYPSGEWYFNPFAWQFLFVFGAWYALGGRERSVLIIRSRWFLIAGVAYLSFALLMTLGVRLPEVTRQLPDWLYDAFNPNDKTNLAPYRVIHLAIMVAFISRFIPRGWPGVEWKIFAPAIVCGRQSLEVFCVGVFLSAQAHIILVEVSDSIWMQILLSTAGITILTIVAYYRSWSKRVDRVPDKSGPNLSSS